MGEGRPKTQSGPANGAPHDRRAGVRADFWFGLGLAALGIFIAVESWRMPRLAELNVHPMTAPGLVPGLLGAILFLLGGILSLRSARAGGWRARRDREGAGDLAVQAGRFLLAATLCVGYAAGLVTALPFSVATGIFVFGFIVLFEWHGERSLTGHSRALAVAAFEAVLVAVAVTYVFEQIFLVRLP